MNMKKIMLAVCLAVAFTPLHAQVTTGVKKENKHMPVFKFIDGETHDFGTIKEGEPAEYTFRFTNVGKEPLIITWTTTSTGALVADGPKAPIMPGKSNQVTVRFYTEGKNGPFIKTIYIRSNARCDKDRYELYIKGTVIPKEAQNSPAKG